MTGASYEGKNKTGTENEHCVLVEGTKLQYKAHCQPHTSIDTVESDDNTYECLAWEDLDWDTPPSPALPPDSIDDLILHIAEERKDVWPDIIPAAKNNDSLKVYTACQQFATHNQFGPKIALSSCNNIEAWRSLSTQEHIEISACVHMTGL